MRVQVRACETRVCTYVCVCVRARCQVTWCHRLKYERYGVLTRVSSSRGYIGHVPAFPSNLGAFIDVLGFMPYNVGKITLEQEREA